MNLNKMAATAVMAGALGSATLGIGAGLVQADPNGPNVPGPGPNVPPGQVNVPPGQVNVPPADYNEPTRYGLPATWRYNDQDLPLVYNPGQNAWGVNASDGFHVYTPAGGAAGQAGGQAGVQQDR